MRIAVGSDHRGFKAKAIIIKALAAAGHSYQDFGTFTPEPVDYPDIARPLAEAVAKGGFDCGILICDTGIGMSITANKVDGIWAALCCNAFFAQRARLHNNANILCLSARHKADTIRQIVNIFLTTQFEGGRHNARLDKIKAMEC